MSKKEKIDQNLSRTERMKKIRESINKKAGCEVAYNLNKENPTTVKNWIPTGSRWLDSIICKNRLSGVPSGKILELGGVASSGKSYLALQIGINALQKGIDVFYFDSESAIDETFLESMGYCVDDFMYIQAINCEFVLQTIEDLLGSNPNPMLFIWDSVAMTPAKSDQEGDYNPNATVGIRARVLSRGFQKLTIPLANSNSTLLVVNQLKPVIGDPKVTKYSPVEEKYYTPGGKALLHACSLRIWLTLSNSKNNRISNVADERVGSLVKANIVKSRFGSDGRRCQFKILWRERFPGELISIQDRESWYEAIKPHPRLKVGAWCVLKTEEGEEYKFQQGGFVDKLVKEPEFEKEVLKCMDELYIGRTVEEEIIEEVIEEIEEK